MIWGILILVAAVLAVLEKIWAPRALKALQLHGSCDKICAEPGEVVTWTATVSNSGRVPIPFVRLVQRFPADSAPVGDAKWIKSHCQRTLQQWHMEERLALAPRRSCARSVQMKFSTRGQYSIGSSVLAAGDLLGLREESREGQGQQLVIIPERARSQPAMEALGGFLGDISVRRFILEDPVLTVGFRDYTGREPLKSVSWTRTAMTGSLQVKQFDHTAEQNVMILLNVEGGTPDQLEGCFRLTRSVCEELERKKIPFGLRTNGNLPGPVSKLFWLAEGLGESHLNTVLYALGRADYTCFQSFRYLTRQTLLRRRNNESYIVITPDLGPLEKQSVDQLQAAVGNPICVLTGGMEVDQP